MEPTDRPRVKICCIQDEAEAWMAIRHGASALGLVSEMPSGPGVIEETTITRIASCTPPGVASVLLTSRQDVPAIVAQQRRLGTGALQLCDELPEGAHAELRAALPGIALIQVIHVTGPESLDQAQALGRDVDAILLDSGDPRLPVKRLGGTGRCHDWDLSRQIREVVPVPVFLAGGLRPDNVARAIVQVAPYGLDVCSGVRRDGRLDPELLAAFFQALGSA
jgi:phosphoribosylanthranilate isomerase